MEVANQSNIKNILTIFKKIANVARACYIGWQRKSVRFFKMWVSNVRAGEKLVRMVRHI